MEKVSYKHFYTNQYLVERWKQFNSMMIKLMEMLQLSVCKYGHYFVY